MSERPNDELLFDSEASLRLVDRALTDLRLPVDSGEATNSAEAGYTLPEIALMDLPNMLLRAYSEINSVLQNLRQSRDVLQQTALTKIQHTHDKLREVSSATEVAATDMLDGLDRALAMVDELESPDVGESSEREAEIRGKLRNELFGLMTCLQFQDITAQQLSYASSVLVEMEGRLAEIVRMFDPDHFGESIAELKAGTMTAVAFDPAATTQDAETRQAMVDEIFTRR